MTVFIGTSDHDDGEFHGYTMFDFEEELEKDDFDGLTSLIGGVYQYSFDEIGYGQRIKLLPEQLLKGF